MNPLQFTLPLVAALCLFNTVATADIGPDVSATMSDGLIADTNFNGRADSGDTLRYTVTITNRAFAEEALGVSFADVLDLNTTFVPGSIQTTPLALDDAYSVLGNVSISFTAPGVLANDVDPDGVGPALTVSAFQNPSANGGDVTVSVDGSFTYDPPAGFQGVDTFTYTLSDGEGNTDTATVELTVSGMIWFVNAGAASGGDGRLSSPFNGLTGGGSFDANAADAAGDTIFVYSGSYAGGLVLLNSQQMIGQGASLSLATLMGLTPPAGSAALPSTGGSSPVLTASGDNVVLGSGNALHGLNLNGTGGTALSGSGVGALTIADMSIGNTFGSGVHLANGALAVVLTAVSASGGANGIVLENTSGSFSVTGTGSAGSGGTIQNTLGANGGSAGNGVYLNNAADVSLASMILSTHQNFAIRGISVNGFTLLNSTVNGVNGDSALDDEGSIRFSGLTGWALISGCSISGGYEDNVRIANSSGTLNRLTISGTTIGANSTLAGNDGVLVEASGAAQLYVTVTNSLFTSARGDLLQLNALNTATMDWVIVNNQFSNNHPGIAGGGGGVTCSAGGLGSAVNVTYSITDNTFRDAVGIGLNVSKGSGAGALSGTILRNTIGVLGVADSGSAQASGLQVTSSGGGTHSTVIAENYIHQYNENGIYLRANDGDSQLDAVILGNTVSQPGVFALNGLQLNIGGTVTDSCVACAEIANNTLTGSGPFASDDFNLRQRFNTTIQLPGYAGAANNTAAVVAYVQSNNGFPDGTASVSGGGGGFSGAGACGATLLAAPDEVVEQRARLAIGAAASIEDVAGSRGSRTALLTSCPTGGSRSAAPTVLDEAALESIVGLAREQWRRTGLSGEQLAALEAVQWQLGDLDGRQLGRVQGGVVTLDRGGAQHGWFVDPTPAQHEEFVVEVSDSRLKSAAGQGAGQRYDLLTAVLHELGHAAGLADTYNLRARNELMYGTLPVGERRLPTQGMARSAVPSVDDETHFIGAPIFIGNLPPGKSITITFDATINVPGPGGFCEVANQGLVSGANFADVLTDDPDTAFMPDPTVTPVNRPDAPVITASPPTVEAGSAGNLAWAPGGFASYAWSISNGSLTSAANAQSVSYTAGASGNVSLTVVVESAAGCGATNTLLVPIVAPEPPLPGCSFGSTAFASEFFVDALTGTTMTLAFDGTNYWSCSGGGPTGTRLARYDASGAFLASYSPGLDFRSVFTAPDGTLMARAFNSPIIHRQVSPGVFTNSGVSLTGGTLNSQSSVVYNGAGTEFVAMSSGVVSRWDTNGAHLGDVTLQGYGAEPGELDYPQQRGVAAVNGFWMTYTTNRVLSVWDGAGNRVARVVLQGAPNAQYDSFSLSYCNGKVWLSPSDGGADWQGYAVCGPVRVVVLAAEAATDWINDVRDKILGAGGVDEVDIIQVNGSEPIPSLAKLSGYRGVLVFSDSNFSDPVALGDVLADYVDQGGGVVMCTFGFYSSPGLGIGGRLSIEGYLPFTLGNFSAAGVLLMVKDQPAHPLLNQVVSFNGGTSSYQNTSLSIDNGATLVASWSNGEPLVGALSLADGRVVGLNFFPPSSDARSDFWDAATDGAQLMANALLWAGQVAPTILVPPLDLTVFEGAPVAFAVNAVGSAALSYQWRKDGVALAGEMDTNLVFTATLGDSGQYDVIVSNPYGVAVSSPARLTVTAPMLLHFIVPDPLPDGTLPLHLANIDSSPIAPARLAKIQVYGSSDVSLPLGSWTLLANPLVLTNGQVRVDGLNINSAVRQYYRAVELP